VERVFLDTDIFSEILKGRDESVVAAARTYLEARGRFSVTVITVMEIVSGLMRKRASAQLSKFEAMLSGCEIVAFDEEAASLAGTIDAALRVSGTPVGLSDVMIAAIALRHACAVVTGNTAHFEQIRDAFPELKIDNWRRP
jgi:tRNA(fMet)-specific endonuclease VapC